MNLTVSKATPQNASALKKLVEKAYSQYVDKIGKPPSPMLVNYTNLIESSNNQCEVYVVKDYTVQDHVVDRGVDKVNGVIVGMLVLKIADSTILLDNIAVDPDKQGLGIGRMLLEKAENQATEAGFHELLLYTNKKMTENITLYEHFGYKVTHCIKEHGYERIYMSKLLR